MTRSSYPVVIVGAGPTGLTLANLLGKFGVRVLLVEANAATVGEPRAVSIDDESLRVAQQLGMDDVVRGEMVSGYGSEYLGPDRKAFLRVKPRSEPYGHPRRNAFRQPVFEAQLRARLEQFTGVDTRFCCTAESFVDDGAKVALTLRHAQHGHQEVVADYLVACDGARSPIRERLGATLTGSSLDERWLIIDLEDCPSSSPETIVFCDPRRPGILLPGPRNTRRYEFKLLRGETDEQMLADTTVEALLRAHEGVAGSRIVRKTVYHFHARIADRWGRGRVWLAGDAAHLMPPFAGQGMNGGIRDAANLAWKLAAIVRGHIGPGLLDTYERERRGHIRQMVRLALTMGAIFGPPSRLHGWATRNAFRALRLWPAARDWFAEMKYKPAPRFDGGFLLERQLRRRGLVGRMLPQPRLTGRNAGTRLDDALSDGFTLVGIGVDSEVLETISLGSSWDQLIDRRLALTTDEAPIFAEYGGKLLLVRPDRYVMASFTSGEATAIAKELEALLERTWTPCPADGVVGKPARSTILAASPS